MTPSVDRAERWGELTPLIVTNGVTVSALYWAQSIVMRVSAEFGPSAAINLLPGATLAGYAVGVAVLAGWARDLTSAKNLGIHTCLLAAGLGLAAASPHAAIAATGFFVIGLGCSQTQRLLACVTSAVAPARRAQAIGSIIAAGLCGIILARALVPLASAWIGWRLMFASASVLVILCGLAATTAATAIAQRQPEPSTEILPTVISLWRRETLLRRAALQQAMVFAVFNTAWAAYPRLLAADSAAPALWMGLVASLGAAAAIASGRMCGRRDPSSIARLGAGAVALASLTFFVIGQAGGICSAEMALLDAGTQVALVANQARAQSVALSPAMRGRLAAIVTTVGFAGGAIGAAIGNMIS